MGWLESSFLVEAFMRIVPGLPLTLFLAAASISLGFIIAAAAALSITFNTPFIARFARGYIYLFRSTPLLVQMFLIYYGLGQSEAVRESIFWVVLKSPMWCAIIALALNTGAFAGEIFRGAISAIPVGQIEAGKAGGMSTFVRLRRIIFPVGMRIALPSYGNELVMMVKATALASTVTVMELTGLAHKLISETYRSVEVFAVAGAFYLVINIILTRILKRIESRVSQHL